MRAETILSVENLEVGYNDLAILSGVSFLLNAGDSLLISGSNGSGKSTLLKTLMGLIPPISGNVYWSNVPEAKLSCRTLIANGVRYLGQGDRIFPGFSAKLQYAKIGKLFGVEPQSNSHAMTGTKLIESYSIGQRRIHSLEALDQGTSKVFLLDEPLSGLDSDAIKRVQIWCESKVNDGSSLVIVEHRKLHFQKLCNKSLIIQGRSAKIND